MHERNWTLATRSFSAALILTLVAYHETAASLFRTWTGSETFGHGLLVAPISGYLIWMNRRSLGSLIPRPFPLALVLLPLLGFVWLAGRATNTILVEQFCLVAFVPALVLACFGPRVTWSIAFPLGFLFFCVPFGDALRPTLMDITADIAVRALRMSGVPVAREGVFLATPVAQWRIAEACSGLQFLVSGFLLASIFAYVTYRKTWKRLACVGLSAATLIIANGLRAYLLILMGYLTEMRLGRGFEHYALGWVVYIIVMISFFAVGARFRDPPVPEGAAPRSSVPRVPAASGAWVAVSGMAVLLLCLWPSLFSSMSRSTPDLASNPILPPPPRAGWVPASEPAAAWKPAFNGAASETVQTYVKDGATVQCYVAFYGRQREGSEMIQFRNVIARTDDPHWRKVGGRDRRIPLDRGSLEVEETDVRTPDAAVLVWHWYWFPDEFTASPEWAKLLQVRAGLLLGRDRAAVVVLSAPAGNGRLPSEDLGRFVPDMLPSIREAIHRADISP